MAEPPFGVIVTESLSNRRVVAWRRSAERAMG